MCDNKWKCTILSCGEMGSGAAAQFRDSSCFNIFVGKKEKEVNSM